MIKPVSKSKTLNIFFITFTLLFLFACSRVPLTNRRRLMLIPEDDLLSMSFKEYNKVKQTSTLSEDKKSLALLKTVGLQISKVADEFITEKGLNLKMFWEFILIKDDEVVNAWCMPGGKVALYTGILPYTKNKAGVAAVISHEVAHALAQHGNERLSQGMLLELGGLTLSKAMSSKPETARKLWLKVYGVAAHLGFILPYSRTQEYEADYIGLILMAKAGFDPNEALLFWERISKAGGKNPPEFLSTHPTDKKRIAAMKEHLSEAMQYYKRSR